MVVLAVKKSDVTPIIKEAVTGIEGPSKSITFSGSRATVVQMRELVIGNSILREGYGSGLQTHMRQRDSAAMDFTVKIVHPDTEVDHTRASLVLRGLAREIEDVVQSEPKKGTPPHSSLAGIDGSGLGGV